MKIGMLMVVFVIFSTGCATVVNGTTQSIIVNSDPPGAKVILQGYERGETPAVVVVKRKEKTTLLLEKEGYKPHNIQLRRRLSVFFFGNLIIGGIPGALVDMMTGSFYEYASKNVYAGLTPLEDDGPAVTYQKL